MNPLYERTTRITYYDLDCRGKIKLSALLRMVHVAADVNARELGAGYDALAPLDMTFVLQRFGVNIMRMPAYNEDVTIRTWPSGIEKGAFLRRGDMYDSHGEKIMEWASLWLLFDINARRPLRPDALPVPLLTLGDEGVAVRPEKVSLAADWGQAFHKYSHRVSYRDVDTNMHMNNSIYGDLIGDALFPTSEIELEAGPDWKQVQINYLAEMRLGAEVEVTALKEGNCYIVTGESGGRRAFIARVEV
ncbi:MAG: thioesterase [Defluviitaleaceae bacterium]|nr:thioesterase [Defluviitaleaceae bacterium]